MQLDLESDEGGDPDHSRFAMCPSCAFFPAFALNFVQRLRFLQLDNAALVFLHPSYILYPAPRGFAPETIL